MIIICDYCQTSGASFMNEEGFVFHKDCAIKYDEEHHQLHSPRSFTQGNYIRIAIGNDSSN